MEIYQVTYVGRTFKKTLIRIEDAADLASHSLHIKREVMERELEDIFRRFTSVDSNLRVRKDQDYDLVFITQNAESEIKNLNIMLRNTILSYTDKQYPRIYVERAEFVNWKE